ncbi:signal recognition particle-docking protein FtsY [Neisseria yangbaofengii]|uniref:signal recognition particle-docking protein FtsY n=1 Tax=Neisseria yangbaofengii TaxID=2709396 RepID=UPI0013EB0593|nr:signal recognition particle-docking protein FtsY [Neisseria yangbaofengii]
MFDFFRRKKQENPAPEETVKPALQHSEQTAAGEPAQSVEEMLAALENAFAKAAAEKSQAVPPTEEISVENIENQSVEAEILAKQTQTETLIDDVQAEAETSAEMPFERIAAQIKVADDVSIKDRNAEEIVLSDDGKVVIDYVQVPEGTAVVSVTPEQAEAIADEHENTVEPSEAVPSAESHVRPQAAEEAEIQTWETTFPEPETEQTQAEEAGPAEAVNTQEHIEIEEVKLDESPEETPSKSVLATAVTTDTAAQAVAEEDHAQNKLSWASRLKQGLAKSRDKMAKSLAGVFGGGKIDEDLYEELETVLITSDMGMEATNSLMKDVRDRVSLKGLKDGGELRGALKDAIYDLIKPLEQPLVLPESNEPFVIMLAGINGAGKTTSIGKLAKYFQSQGKSVLLAAGDTFRAAAREQLQEWGERNNVTVISQSTGDSAAVCFDAVQAAKARGIDIVLADTAGRLPTQLHLMEEIKKVKRVLQKAIPDAPHEIIVVLDANIGQNAVNQVKAFDEALGLTGLIVTKLDGTAKGGILAALAGSRPIPVRYIGVGERIDDLRPFDARAFVDALLD